MYFNLYTDVQMNMGIDNLQANQSFCIPVMSTDWTISDQASIGSKISSVNTFSSSMMHLISSFCIPYATSTFFGSLFQVRPGS